jgi:prepilin-type processing-associated H-X9-DG protein
MKRHATAFTLVELLVVIGIIALLISILLPSLNKARAAAQRTVCASNLRQIGVMWYQYAQVNKGWFPDCLEYGGTWEILTPQKKETFVQLSKMTSGKVFYCPNALGFSPASKEGGDATADWNNQINTGIGMAYHIGYSIYAHNGNAIAWNKYFSANGTSPTRPSIPPPRKTKDPKLVELPLVMDGVQKFLPPNEPFVTWAYSNHFDPRTRLPAGGNTLFGDGHVNWRDFKEMKYMIMWSSNLDHERWW